uniref:Huntingtin n=1 Tax=Naja naja TaxID=35670 RepID=A0A8C6Y6F0_NAJNA
NHCLTICENIVAQSLRNSPEFPKLLGIAMELFLLCSDDAESDVRMVSDECLNKVIKLYKEIKKNGASRSLRAALWRFAELAHLVRPQKCRPYFVNLLPCLTRVSRRPEESVQETLAAAMPKIMAAFGNFANDSDIKVLLKAFIGNLNSNSPTIRRTAAAATVSICQHSRRTQYFYTRLLQVLLGLLCPKEEEHPSVLILGVLLTLRYLIPLLQQEVKDTSLKGSFGVIQKETEISPSLDQLIQVYELSLHYTQHRDHNVVTGSLELLQQLLRTPPPNLLLALTMRGGLLHADAAKDEIVSRSRSDSIVELIAGGGSSCSPVFARKQKGDYIYEICACSLYYIIKSSFLLLGSVKSELNSELTSMSGVSPAASSASDPPGCDIITEQPRSQHVLQSESEISACDLTGATPKADTDDDILSRSSSQISAIQSDMNDGTSSPISDSSQTTTEGPDSAVTPSDFSEMVKSELQRSHLPKSVSHRREPSNSSMEKFGPKEETELADNGSKLSRMKGDIGGYKDGSAAPLVHCVRLLSASFLLTGEKGALVPDKDVRVSVKALAISCVGAAVALHPEAFFSKLYKMPTEKEQSVKDIVNYIDHGDPQIRGTTAILCGTIIYSILVQSCFSVESWLENIKASTGNVDTLVECVSLLQKSLKDESSVTCKLACIAVRHCIMSLCGSNHSSLGLQLLVDLLLLRNSSYWLVRTELLETVAEIDFRLIQFLEERDSNLHRGDHHYMGLLKLQDRVLKEVVISLLGDEDPRVRRVAAAALVRLVPKLYSSCDAGQADPVVALAKEQSSIYLKLLMHETPPTSQFAVSTITRTYRGYNLMPSPADVTVENNLSRVVSAVSHALTTSPSRSLTFGCCEALCLLSSSFSVCTWNVGWHCGFSHPGGVEESQEKSAMGMVGLLLSFLSSISFPLDLSAHQDALILAGNLLAGKKNIFNFPSWIFNTPAKPCYDPARQIQIPIRNRLFGIQVVLKSIGIRVGRYLGGLLVQWSPTSGPGTRVRRKFWLSMKMSPLLINPGEEERRGGGTCSFTPLHLAWLPAASVSTVQLWVSGILAILRVLISQSTEDIVLSRIQELSFSPHLISCQTIHRLRNGGNKIPPTQEIPTDEQDRFLPEETFSRFLMQLVGILLEDISSKQLNVEMSEQQHTFYCQELGTLLMCLIHTFKSGMFRRITAVATKLFTESGPHGPHFYTLERLNDLVKSMIATHPSLVLLWCQILLLVNYTSPCWWSEVHQTPKRQSLSSAKLLSPQPSGDPHDEDGGSKLSICNREIVRKGSLILFCDYVCQNLHDSEHLTWLTVNHVQELISLSHEPPVQDFISAIHRNSAASGLFIQAIQSRCENFASPTAVKKTLQCLEGIHLSQSGAVLVLYVDKLLSTPFRVLAHMVDTLACRRVEMLLAASVQNSTAQLPVEELDRIQEYLQNAGLAHRHQRLYSLLDRFRLMVAPETISPSPLVTAHPLDGGNHPALETLIPDKDWFCSLVRSQCYTKSAFALPEGAELMYRLPEQELLPFMMHQDFNISLLTPCLSLGGQELSRGLRSHFEAARLVTLHQVTEVVNKLPAGHQVFQPMQPMGSSPYWNKLSNIYGDPEMFQFTMVLAQALSQYLVLLSKLPASLRIPREKENDIVKFVVMLLEILSWHLARKQVPLSMDLQAVLDCCCLALQQTELWNLLASTENSSQASSLIHCTRFILVAVAIEPGNCLLSPGKRKKIQKAASENEKGSQTPNSENITATCEVVAELVECLQSVLTLGHKKNSPIPAFLTPVLRNIIISLSRLPLVNSYARVPLLVWKLGWSPKPTGEFGTTFPEIPVEFLQEREIFKEFIYRINTLGWTNRMQFEETWASLLGVLVTQPIIMDQEENQQEEDMERTQINVLAVQAITSLVLSAMTIPLAGNPAVSCLEQQPRNKTLKALDTRFGRKLNIIRGIVEQEIQEMASKRDNVACHHVYQVWDPVPSLTPSTTGALISHEKLLLQINTEREMGNMRYKLGQVSIHSVWLGNSITPLREEEWGGDEDDESDMPALTSPPSSPINSRKHRAGVDIHSCSQFLLELYSQWILPSSPNKKTPVTLISEVVRSLLAVSDLFTERNQFEMMYTTLTELRKVHPSEDEILLQYLVPAICKAAAVLGMDKAVAEPVSRLLESTLRSAHMPSRIGALHGILYILECDLLDETAKQLIPVITEYLLSNLRGVAHCVNLHNQQHILVMCAVAFYLIENYPADVGPEFSSGIIQMCGLMLSENEGSTPSVIYHCVLRGLERLLLSEQLSQPDCEALVKLSVDRVNVLSPHRAMAALGLMLSCMYTGKEKVSPGRSSDPQSAAPDSESVIVAMERVSVLFDRVRKGFPFEARVQPYPQFMAKVLYKVFQSLHTTGQSSMVRDWVMLSLSNFTQRTPIAMAMWSLSCFFVSASTSHWISGILPHIISRMGKSEQVDLNLFCLVAIDFYRHQIDEELDRRAFQSIFEVVSSPGNPYHRLLTCLQSIHKITPC